MGETSAAIESGRLGAGPAVRPYAPSWIDRLTDWIDRMPGPSWRYYLFLWLVPVAAVVLAKWADGTYAPPYLNPGHVVLASGVAYVTIAIAFLDRAARYALAIFRPASTLTDDQCKDYEYRLTTLPARLTLVWTVVPLVLVVAVMGMAALFEPSVWATEVKKLGLFASPLSMVVDGLCFIIWAPLLGVWYYHTYHQLKAVDELYIRFTRIDLFYLRPLYAFSRLTAYTAIALLIPTYMGPISVPGYMEDPVFLADTAGLLVTSIIAVAIFIGPLVGIHNLLVSEKEKLRAASAKRVESALTEFDRRIDALELQDMVVMKNTLDGLVTKQTFIDHIPTWPWSTDTSRLVASAITLPIILYVIQRLIEIIVRP